MNNYEQDLFEKNIKRLEKKVRTESQESAERGKVLEKLRATIIGCEDLIEHEVYEKLISILLDYEERCTKRGRFEKKKRTLFDDARPKRKRFVPPTIPEVEQYIAENPELSNIDAVDFWKGYDDGGWIDTQGKPVRNWKLKLRTRSKFATANEKPARKSAAELFAESRDARP